MNDLAQWVAILLLLGLLVALSYIATSASRYTKGDTGPMGPAGPMGFAGPPGKPGRDCTDTRLEESLALLSARVKELERGAVATWTSALPSNDEEGKDVIYRRLRENETAEETYRRFKDG